MGATDLMLGVTWVEIPSHFMVQKLGYKALALWADLTFEPPRELIIITN